MAKLLISYRRDDTGGTAGRILERLSSEFGWQNVFIDVGEVLGRFNIRDDIGEALQDCSVLLVLVGKNWLEENSAGQRRMGATGRPRVLASPCEGCRASEDWACMKRTSCGKTWASY